MAYTKTNWVNGYTPLNASNMNKIEEGIYSNDTFLSSLDIRVNTLEGSIGQGGIGSVVVNGNGNALTNVSYTPSTKILNFEKNTTFALDSDLDSVNNKNLYHLGAYDSISGNVITRQTGYRNVSKWFLENANNLTFRSTAVGYQIGKDGGNGLLSNPYLEGTLATGISNKDFIFADDNASYGNTSNYILNSNWISLPNTFNTKESYLNYFSQNEIIIQYKLNSSYTEQINENQPLTTLDQSGSQWLRSEWEKGLNLWSNGNISANKTYSQILPAGTYTYSFILNATASQGVVIKIGNTNIISESISTGYHSYTFTTNGDTLTHLQYGGNSTNVMLNEGSHAYPYHAYQGGIAREDQLVQRKLFSARDSTMDDVKSFVNNNHYRIISIMYFADSERYSKGRSVIYNADEGSYFYINSDHTFSDVQLNINATQNRYDYIYIHYHKY